MCCIKVKKRKNHRVYLREEEEDRMEKTTIINSLIYKFMERCGYQGIAFLVQIVLARLLSPTDYGVISLLTIFINVSQVFVQSGLNTALIQKKEVDEVDYSSVFFVSIGIAVGLYGVLFFAAPYIALFYNMPELSKYLRILAIILIPGAFNSIQNAQIARKMEFKKLMYSTWVAVIVSGIVGILLAYLDFGTWALVFQQLTNQILICIILFKLLEWRPSLKFSWKKVRVLFSFGWKLLCSSLIETIYTNLQGLVIGKKFNSSTLGVYNRGKQFPQLLVDNINGSIQSIMLPTLSKYQDDKEILKSMMRRSIVTSSLIIFPLLTLMGIIARPLITLVLTDKWSGCVPYMIIYCFIYAFMPIHTANLQAINAQGRSDQFLKLEIVKKCYGVLILCITIGLFESPIAIAIGGAVSTLISCFVNAHPNKKLLDYSYLEQMKDILPEMLLSFIMGVAIYPISFINMPDILLIIIQVICGIFVYCLLALIFKLEPFLYLVNTIRMYIGLPK